jgi:hypothetical protein
MKKAFSVIWINGMPRSGTSWLGQIFDSHPDVCYRLSPLFSYRFKNRVNENATPDEWNNLFKQVYEVHDEFMEQMEKKIDGRYPTFSIKTSPSKILAIKSTRFHNLVEGALNKIEDIKIVHIVRNPCAVINSWIKAPKEFPPDSDIETNWRTGKNRKTAQEEFWGFDDWKKLSYLYIYLSSKYPKKVYMIRYEKIVDNPEYEIEKLFRWVGLNIHPQTKQFLIDSMISHISDPYAVFKKSSEVKSRWRNELPRYIADEIYNDLSGTELEEFLD